MKLQISLDAPHAAVAVDAKGETVELRAVSAGVEAVLVLGPAVADQVGRALRVASARVTGKRPQPPHEFWRCARCGSAFPDHDCGVAP